MAHFNAEHLVKKEMAKLFEAACQQGKLRVLEEPRPIKPPPRAQGRKPGDRRAEAKAPPKLPPKPPHSAVPFKARRRQAIIMESPPDLVPNQSAPEWVKDGSCLPFCNFFRIAFMHVATEASRA